MKLTQTIVQKTFMVEHNGKTYTVDFLDSDGQALCLLNRDQWEIFTEDGECLDTYEFKADSSARKKKVAKNVKLAEELISFCEKHFNDYA